MQLQTHPTIRPTTRSSDDPDSAMWIEAVPTLDPEAPEGSIPSAIHLYVTGDLDQAATSEVEAAALGAIESGTPLVVIDLAGVLFIDSAGLRSIVRAANAAEACGVRFVVAGMSGGVERLLQLTGLLERLRRAEEGNSHN